MISTITAAQKVYLLLDSIDMKKYLFKRDTKDTSNDEQFIIINVLPMNADVMQRCYVNVNYHCKNIVSGVPDAELMAIAFTTINNLLDAYSDSTCMIDLDRHEIFVEDSLNYSFYNLRYSFKFINN